MQLHCSSKQSGTYTDLSGLQLKVIKHNLRTQAWTNTILQGYSLGPTTEDGQSCLKEIIWDPEASVSQTIDELTCASEVLPGREIESTYEFGSFEAFGICSVVVSRGGLQILPGKQQDKEIVPFPGFTQRGSAT